MNRKERIIYRIGITALGIFLGVAAFCLQVITWAGAEDAPEETWACWVMCQPGGEVMIRERPGRKAPAVGAAACGERMRTDWEERDGWVHLVDVNNETGEGWIFGGYIVCEEPREVNRLAEVHARGRVACRKWIGGKRRSWIRSGDTVEVYLAADGWAVTNRGFIRAEYLEVPEE